MTEPMDGGLEGGPPAPPPFFLAAFFAGTFFPLPPGAGEADEPKVALSVFPGPP